jgi:hypothetical protein
MSGQSGQFEIVVVDLRQDADGLYTATSRHLAGMCVVHRDRDAIKGDMPDIVRHWYKRNRGIEVEVFWGEERQSDGTTSIPAMTVPVEVAAQALGR